MIIASVRDFLCTGRLGDISCHLEESEVIRLIGLPDDDSMSYPTTYHGCYGCLNIQYDAATKRVAVLFIQVDDPEFPATGPSITIEPWQIRPGMTPSEFVDALSKNRIDFVEEPFSGNGRFFRVNGCTTALFDLVSPGVYGLSTLASYDPQNLPD